jgi:HAD superfamily hydrolase (TIGR01484 family)
MKKVLEFDLDDTLALAKSPIEPEMAELLTNLLNHYDLCIISGAMFSQFEKQVLDRMTNATPEQLTRLHIMPTQGTSYYHFNFESKNWEKVYGEDLSEEDVVKITPVLEEAARESGYWEENPAGEIIENRGPQVTFSALGQQADKEAKYAWDPTREKRNKIVELAAPKLPNLELKLGGTTSIDVTLPGLDKAYGTKRLLEHLGLDKSDVLFFGDMTQPGGNDYPVTALGIDTITVRDWQDTAFALRGILMTTK